MLRVVDDPLALAREERNRIADHREVLVRIDLRDLLEVELPRLADEAARGYPGLGHQPQACVVRCAHVAPAGHAKGDDLRMLEPLVIEQLEAALVLRIRAEEAGLDP